ncbi:hypothetical protein AAG570_003898 [Ranatra chinensis]|uniref:ZSWIM3 N-terminal domain-containing protein n=1 Tax=Ranatra chinensis TaxID=642074 RepID=A0ABD0YGS6_9HEMI
MASKRRNMVHKNKTQETTEKGSLRLKEYEKQVLNEYWIRDSRTLRTQSRRFPDSIAARADNSLKYFYLRIACIKGGRMHEFKNVSRRTVSFKQGCQAGMFLKLSACGRFLEMLEINENHNHNISLCKSKNALRYKRNLRCKQNLYPEDANDQEATMEDSSHDLSYVRRKPKSSLSGCAQDNENAKELKEDAQILDLTSSKKIEMMNAECLKLANICSQVSSNVFLKRLKLIKKLVDKWGNDQQESSLTDVKEEILDSNNAHTDYVHDEYAEYISNIDEVTDEKRFKNNSSPMRREKDGSSESNKDVSDGFLRHIVVEHNYFKPHRGFEVIFIKADEEDDILP